MIAIELAWKIVDSMIEEYKDYDSAVEELGDIEALALRISDFIDEQELHDETDMVFLKSYIDQEIF